MTDWNGLLPSIIIEDAPDAVQAEKLNDLIACIRQQQPTVLEIVQSSIQTFLTTENDANRSKAIEILAKVLCFGGVRKKK